MTWWLRIASWHIVAGVTARTDRPGWLRTYCGRLVRPDTPKTSTPDPEERTCESCFRLRERHGQA